MYPAKRSVLLVVGLLKAYGIRQIVLSPGSRNAPLIHCFMQDPFFECQTVVDERNAAFVALGMMQATQQPVVVCCTSGTALLNYSPAVAEAFYQQLPLIVLSADRSPEWIDQMDGQTLPQPNAFGTMSKKSVSLPEVYNDASEWYCKRLCHEALLVATGMVGAPVHINLPLSEPLFDFSAKEIPTLDRVIHQPPLKTVSMERYEQIWGQAKKKLLVIGQLPPTSKRLLGSLERLAQKHDCVILAEHLSNIQSPYVFSSFDTLIAALPNEDLEQLSPDLLVTLGGHIVSKRLKQWLRTVRPAHHWLVTYEAEVIDLYQSLTDIIEVSTETFLSTLSRLPNQTAECTYFNAWKEHTDKIVPFEESMPYSDLSVVRGLLRHLPKGAYLHLANSSSVRNAQLFDLPDGTMVYCNRGTNGIDGNLPTALGFAMTTSEPVYLLIGDLSFFYALSALWNIKAIKNLRILLINNGGGGLFHMVQGLNQTTSLSTVSAMHEEDAKQWVNAAGMKHLKATDAPTLEQLWEAFMAKDTEESVLLEACVHFESGPEVLRNYYKQQKYIFHGNK